MDITERAIGNTIVLDIREGSTVSMPHGLERAIDRLGQAGWRRFVANLEHVSAIDAGGLGALLSARRASVRHRGTLRLARARPRIHQLIVITHLPRVLETFNSVDDALDDEHQGYDRAFSRPYSAEMAGRPDERHAPVWQRRHAKPATTCWTESSATSGRH